MSNQTDEVIDANARVLKLRRLTSLEQSRVVLMVGGEAAANGPYMSLYVFPACSVCSIDGDEVEIPTTMRELEALIQRVDDVGLQAITAHFIDRAKGKKNSGEMLQAKN